MRTNYFWKQPASKKKDMRERAVRHNYLASIHPPRSVQARELCLVL